MSAARRRKTSTRLALRIARAQLRAIRGFVPIASAQPHPMGPAHFIQCWAVGRGYSAVTQALDSEGQVWERHSVIEKTDGVSRLKDSWWEALDMKRGKS
jgi:hypothetical protein